MVLESKQGFQWKEAPSSGWTASFHTSGSLGVDMLYLGMDEKAVGSWKSSGLTTEDNMYRMNYGLVVNCGLSKTAELKRSDLLLLAMLFPGWKTAIWALIRQTSWMNLWCVCVCVCMNCVPF